jgi:hypothetical protein
LAFPGHGVDVAGATPGKDRPAMVKEQAGTTGNTEMVTTMRGEFAAGDACIERWRQLRDARAEQYKALNETSEAISKTWVEYLFTLWEGELCFDDAFYYERDKFSEVVYELPQRSSPRSWYGPTISSTANSARCWIRQEVK